MRRRFYFLNAFVSLFICAILAQTNFFHWLSEKTLDQLFHIRGHQQTSQSIVIIGIDEESLSEIGPWPFPRNFHARLLEKISVAKVIGFDLLFTQEQIHDQQLNQAIKKSPPVVLAITKNYQGELLKPPAQIQDHVTLGHIDTSLGRDGIVRRVRLEKWGYTILSGAMYAKKTAFNRTSRANTDDTIINYYGPEFTFLYLSYNDVLEGKIDKEFFRDRYILIGAKAIALGDVHITPYSRKHPMPGVEIQATILNNYLDDSFIYDVRWLSYLASIFAFFLVVWVWPDGKEGKNVVSVIVATVLILFSSTVLFHFYEFFVDPSFPIIVFVLSYFVHLLSQLLWITTKLIRQMAHLDRQLVNGLETFHQTIPAQLVLDKRNMDVTNIPGGIRQHISHIHRGIQALSLQNSFINHLLNHETPPLILWEKENGKVLLANEGFQAMWKEFAEVGQNLPELEIFYSFLATNGVDQASKIPVKKSQDLDNNSYISDTIIDISIRISGRKRFIRVVHHEVQDMKMGLAGIMASFTDVTEIRELERVKGEMMNIVSHELKLPLTTIMGFGEMLQERLGGKEQQFANQICDQSNRLAKMIEDFLDISRIESGGYSVNKYPFDLLASVYDAISCVTHMATNKLIDIEQEIPEKISPLLGDEVLITQALINILDNAVKFSPERSTIRIEIVEKEEIICLKIEDEGPGISDTDKKTIFQKFSRGSQQTRESGFGLGLSLVHQVIESHGGNIEVLSIVGEGTAFLITLPKVR